MEDMQSLLIERRLALIEDRLSKLERQKSAPAPSKSASGPASGDKASDAELDGPYGDPVVRKDPPRWKGPTHVGMTFSQCSAEYLESLAGFFDWQAMMDEEQGRVTQQSKRPTAPYKRKDAARARGWAARRRVAAHTSTTTVKKPAAEPAPEPDFDFEDDGDVAPF